MKTRNILLAFAFCLAAVIACFANPALGTWKLNEAKSKIPAGAIKNQTVVYTQDGDNLKCEIDGTTGDGKPYHTVWTGKFDGKQYPVKDDPYADTRGITMVDNNHYKISTQKDGKEISTGVVTTAPDGKSRTVKIRSKGPDGKLQAVTFVYDKQ